MPADAKPPTGVVVLGARGRMGVAVCEAVASAPDCVLVGAVDPSHAGESDATDTTQIVSSLEEIDSASAPAGTVAVDFTVADAARRNAHACAERGMHAVVGTSGLGEDDFATFRDAFVTSNCLVAPNFAIGAVLMMRFAEMAAPLFPTAEVIELHHDQKVDAPSGTATQTLRRMAAASADWAGDPTTHTVIEGARGGAGPADIRVHSVRLRGLVAHQEVLFGGEGETLTIRHDSLDRSSFMSGVLLACREVASHPGVTVGLEHYLGI